MTEEAVSQEEMLDAVEEAAADCLQLYRSLVENETCEGVIHDRTRKRFSGIGMRN